MTVGLLVVAGAYGSFPDVPAWRGSVRGIV
jgi:hypothetical protein